jgi:putative iron-dependent peroxidase
MWVHGDNHSDNFDIAMAIAIAASRALSSVSILQWGKIGFVYKDSRDLSGFIDGTENPKGRRQRTEALIPEGEVGADGSFVMSQQWVHNLAVFHQLSDSD